MKKNLTLICEHCRHWQKMSNAYKLFDNDYFPQKSVMGMQLRLKGTCVLIPSFLLMLMTLSQYFLSSLEDCAWREHWITLFWVHQLNEGQGEFNFRGNVMLISNLYISGERHCDIQSVPWNDDNPPLSKVLDLFIE